MHVGGAGMMDNAAAAAAAWVNAGWEGLCLTETDIELGTRCLA